MTWHVHWVCDVQLGVFVLVCISLGGALLKRGMSAVFTDTHVLPCATHVGAAGGGRLMVRGGFTQHLAPRRLRFVWSRCKRQSKHTHTRRECTHGLCATSSGVWTHAVMLHVHTRVLVYMMISAVLCCAASLEPPHTATTPHTKPAESLCACRMCDGVDPRDARRRRRSRRSGRCDACCAATHSHSSVVVGVFGSAACCGTATHPSAGCFLYLFIRHFILYT